MISIEQQCGWKVAVKEQTFRTKSISDMKYNSSYRTIPLGLVDILHDYVTFLRLHSFAYKYKLL